MDINQALEAFREWFVKLKLVKANNGPANGTIATTLVLLERLKEVYDLNFESHIAPGGAQIKGASGTAVAYILNRFGETRPFAKEGGRTNRGGQGEVRPLFSILENLNLGLLTTDERNDILNAFQEFLVERVRDFHNRQKLKFTFNSKLSTWKIISSLLEEAKVEGKTGFVAQHLVGAKLQLRFPDVEISNESASTADAPTNREGDFIIGNTIFHVTVAPMPPVFLKCQQNIQQGLKPYMLVPDAKLAGARQMGEAYCNGQLAVESLESFISQNIDEISTFDSGILKQSITKLIGIYNDRVNEVEIDKSLMIEIPANLQ